MHLDEEGFHVGMWNSMKQILLHRIYPCDCILNLMLLISFAVVPFVACGNLLHIEGDFGLFLR